MKPFKKIRGFRVYLLAPEVAVNKIHMSNEVKKSVSKQKVEDFMKLKVYAVGESVTDINEGDVVCVDDRALSTAPFIDITKDITVIVVSAHDIHHIW